MRFLGRLLILAALLILAFSVSEAWGEEGQTPLNFRAEAAAAGEYITLNNLAELAPDLAQKYGQALIWSAPPPGQFFTLTREFLQYRLTQMGLAGLLTDANLPAAIQVRQNGIVLNSEEIAAAYRRYIQHQNPWPASEVRIQIYPQDEPVLLPDKQFTLEVLPPKGQDRFLGEVALEMAVLKEGRLLKKFKVSGKVTLEQTVVCATLPLPPQTVIGPKDVHLSRRDVTSLNQRDIFTSEKQVIGHVLAKGLGPQEILTSRHMDHKPIIKRGEEVTVVLDQNGLVISTKGVTREDGYLGRQVRVRNGKSKKEFQAEVLDAKTVKVVL
ncbi:MAG: flagellar basal body P-ring formation protein FlgA [Deltaproteobacteria bacterium]|nr:flagellar basal body P-ring formation protein FlgA [Deltaproteobacteria bacterium]MBI4796873.1 flagellar basal body P-ring formation protein FlgA [Deltaproteobacteria bacterium]